MRVLKSQVKNEGKMVNQKVILGLDIGIGSVGWGLVNLKEEKYIDENPTEQIWKNTKYTMGK